MIAIVDRHGKSLNFAYNADDNLISQKGFPTSGQTATVLFSFDPNGNRKQVIDPNGNVNKLTYNPFGLLATVTNPKGNTEKFTYDGAYNVANFIDEAAQFRFSTIKRIT